MSKDKMPERYAIANFNFPEIYDRKFNHVIRLGEAVLLLNRKSESVSIKDIQAVLDSWKPEIEKDGDYSMEIIFSIENLIKKEAVKNG